MASLEFLNLTHNKLTEFSLDEIQGLTRLDTVELSYNKIVKFIGKTKVTVLTIFSSDYRRFTSY